MSRVIKNLMDAVRPIKPENLIVLESETFLDTIANRYNYIALYSSNRPSMNTLDVYGDSSYFTGYFNPPVGYEVEILGIAMDGGQNANVAIGGTLDVGTMRYDGLGGSNLMNQTTPDINTITTAGAVSRWQLYRNNADLLINLSNDSHTAYFTALNARFIVGSGPVQVQDNLVFGHQEFLSSPELLYLFFLSSGIIKKGTKFTVIGELKKVVV